MATQKQRRAFKEIVENGGNVSLAMVRAGYSPKTAHTPSKLTASRAFMEFEEVYMESGLDVELIIKSLVEDIKGKPMGRVAELLLASKLLGLLDKARQGGTGQEKPIPILNNLRRETDEELAKTMVSETGEA